MCFGVQPEGSRGAGAQCLLNQCLMQFFPSQLPSLFYWSYPGCWGKCLSVSSSKCQGMPMINLGGQPVVESPGCSLVLFQLAVSSPLKVRCSIPGHLPAHGCWVTHKLGRLVWCKMREECGGTLIVWYGRLPGSLCQGFYLLYDICSALRN